MADAGNRLRGPRGFQARLSGRELYWENIVVLVLTHALGLAGIVYAARVGISWKTGALAAAWFGLCVLSTTAGYHRLFAHRSYRAAAGVRLFYLIFGAASAQGPVVRWASDHRMHHAYTDTDADPYNVKRGFWWAHVGWLLYRSPPGDRRYVQDLRSDPLVRLQERFYLPLAAGAGFLVPTLIAWSWGEAAGGLLLAGFLRLALQYQATFCVNSVAHTFGRRPYSRESSARDSFLAALLTLGEGYHNFHHRFPWDYRNGVRMHQFDPTKWWVWLLSAAGLAWNLRRASARAIAQARAAAAARSGPSPEAASR